MNLYYTLSQVPVLKGLTTILKCYAGLIMLKAVLLLGNCTNVHIYQNFERGILKKTAILFRWKLRKRQAVWLTFVFLE